MNGPGAGVRASPRADDVARAEEERGALRRAAGDARVRQVRADPQLAGHGHRAGRVPVDRRRRAPSRPRPGPAAVTCAPPPARSKVAVTAAGPDANDSATVSPAAAAVRVSPASTRRAAASAVAAGGVGADRGGHAARVQHQAVERDRVDPERGPGRGRGAGRPARAQQPGRGQGVAQPGHHRVARRPARSRGPRRGLVDPGGHLGQQGPHLGQRGGRAGRGARGPRPRSTGAPVRRTRWRRAAR